MTRRPPSDPTAVVARRGGAWFIDTVLCLLAGAVPALLLADAYAFDRASGGLAVERNDGDLAVFVRDTVIVLRPDELAVTVAALLAAVLALLVLLPGRRGWSPGHLAADLRLVRADGGRAGVGRALVRTVAWVVDILPGLPLVAYVSARLTRRHQRVGDLVARTYVVDKRAAGHPVGRPLGEEGPVLAPEPVLEETTDADDAPPVPPPPEPPAPVGGGPPAGVPPDEAIWDRRHRRYVLWHSKAGRWLEHAEHGWVPLGGQERNSGGDTG